jgi:hypothetical protein
MGPPKKGTLKYTKYLLQQAKRRRTDKKNKTQSDRAEAAEPFVAAALREAQRTWQAELDATVADKNRKFRENGALLRRCNHLATDNEKRHQALKQAKARQKELTDELAEATSKFLQASKGLRRWDLWWAWVAAKASPALLAHLGRLGRSPPKSSGDRGWGGGQ